jgi:hypothetical protein
VLPDGRLLVDVQVWSDATFEKPGARPNGVYTSDGRDWSTLVRLEPGEDSGLSPAERRQVLTGRLGVVGMSVAPGDVTVYVADARPDPLCRILGDRILVPRLTRRGDGSIVRRPLPGRLQRSSARCST